MIYKETGQYKSSYKSDHAIFPLIQDKIAFSTLMFIAFLVIPFVINSYWEKAILVPFLIFSLAAIGLNILTGYCGQVSLGTGGFMAVGAFSTYKIMTYFPDMNIMIIILISGLITAGVGILFGLPSLRIKGFYLAVATLAAQFFLVWLFNKVPWFYNYSDTGQITVSERLMFGIPVTGASAPPYATYLFCLVLVVLLGFAAKNLIRSKIGRSWMAIRDMDALYFAVFLGAIEVTESFDIMTISFPVLFMIIIGGLGSMLGSFLGAAFIVTLPIGLKFVMVDMVGMSAVTAKHFEITIWGLLMIIFLIVEPHGLARLWSIAKEKLRRWPFPY
jgi:branched-chain amino acid transport system permease protein